MFNSIAGAKNDDVKPQRDLLFGLEQFETFEKPDTAATPQEERLDSTPLLQENPSSHTQPAQCGFQSSYGIVSICWFLSLFRPSV